MSTLTEQDWKEVYDRLFVSFPGLYNWLLDSCPKVDGRPNVRGTLEVWRHTLQSCTKRELMSVLDSWISGDRKPPEAYNRELTALTLKSCVLFDRSKNAPKRKQEDYARLPSDQNVPSIFAAVANCLKIREEGGTDEQVRNQLEQELAKFSNSGTREPTYRCWICRDSGVRLVWRVDELDQIRQGKFQRGVRLHSYGVGCICEKGAAMSASDAGWKHGRMARYDAEIHCDVSKDPFEFVEQSIRGKEWVA